MRLDWYSSTIEVVANCAIDDFARERATRVDTTDPSVDQGFVRRRFEASASASTAEPGVSESEGTERVSKGLTKPLLIAGCSMLAIGLISLVASAGFSTEPDPVIAQAQKDAISLQAEAETARMQMESLPDRPSALSALSQAKVAGQAVADLQNGYAVATRSIAEHDGVLESEMAEDASRGLSSLFAVGIDESVLQPWYLLESDASVPVGSDIPELFSSGVRWEVLDTTEISLDGNVPVTWVAYDRPGRTEVLAWATGTYDRRAQVFTSVQIGTTMTGAGLEQDWSMADG